MTRHPSFFEGTEMPTAGWWEALWPDPVGVLTRAGVGPGMDVVDLCCGDGWFTLPIARIARHVVAIDIDPSLIEVAGVRLTENGATNCDFRVGDGYELAHLWPHSVDFVFIANAFHGVADRLRLSRAVHAVLKPSGRLAILNWHQRRREETTVLGEPRGPRTELRMSPNETIASVTNAGLNPLQIVEVPPHHYAAIFERPTI
jgi:ubiquinone/menaquinone biosynthesis C-methylase UbiE